MNSFTGSGEPDSRFTARLAEHRLLAILRTREQGRLLPVIHTLVEAGIRCLEVTLPTPGCLEALHSVRTEFGEEVLVGAGTVTTAAEARAAADAGAQFIVSPHIDEDLVRQAARLGLGVLPGVFTPTEVLRARVSGAQAVKLFPASVLGPEFVSALQGPMPDVPVVPTGGIGLDDVQPWLTAGATALGIGGPLTGNALAGGDLAELRARAASFVTAVQEG